MDTNICLTNHFLIAMPKLGDANFFRSVTYICQHDEEGSMGIIINRPLDMNMGEVFNHLDIKCDDEALEQQPLYFGGPVQTERGFVLHESGKHWQNTYPVSSDVVLTTSSDILSDIAHHKGPRNALVALGYAGWGAGQLEQEIGDNAWLSVPSTPEILFDQPSSQRWQAAATLLGVDLEFLSEDIGHA